MKEYFVDEIKNKKVYDNFIQYMLEHSDFFSVVYFRNRKDSPLNKYLKNYKYFVDEIKNKKVYDNFIQYMLEHSDFFSVVYFRNRKDSPLNKYLKNYKKALRPYILHAENTRKWSNQ